MQAVIALETDVLPQTFSERLNIVVESLDRPDSFYAIAAAWRDLEAKSYNPSLFTSADWANYVAQYFTGLSERRIIVAKAYAGNRLVALWPLAIRKQGGLSVLTSIGAPFDQYSEALFACDIDPAPVIDRMIEELRRQYPVDGLVLRKTKVLGPLYDELRRKAHVVDHGEQAPQIHIDPDRPLEEFMQKLNSKTRKNLRNYQNRLKRMGNIEHVVIEGPATAQIIAQCFDERHAWLSDHGYSSEAFRDPHFKSFVNGLAEHSKDLGLVAFILKLDGEAIALQWGFIRGGCYSAFMSCRNPKYEQYSVGRIHLGHIVEFCHQSGLNTLDLMVPASPYKLNWTKQAEPVADLIWPWSAKGHLVLDLVERKVRPVVKHWLNHTPQALRKPVMALLNR